MKQNNKSIEIKIDEENNKNKEKNLNIAIDVDDVIFEHSENFLNHVNDIKGTSFSKKDVISFSFEEVSGFSQEETFSLYESFHFSEKFNDVLPIEGSLESINLLKKEGHNLVIITSRPGNMEELTREWLNQHFPETFDKILFSNHVFFDNKSISKKDFCLKHNIDVILEDSPHYAKNCSESDIKVILFNKPWNSKLESNGNIFRVNNWEEALEKLSEIKNKKIKK